MRGFDQRRAQRRAQHRVMPAVPPVARSRARSLARAALPAALLATASLLAMPLAAQPAADADTGDLGGSDIVVTGSRIAANGFQQPTPVTVLGSVELQREMPPTIADYLNTLPAFGTPVSSANPAVGVSGGGASLLNLRNLGVNRTLVLLDNRRVVSSSPTGGVDINTLPTALVQRVEVVTGGASAAWGADAVAGVVNFVLDHHYTGLGINLSNGISSAGDNRNSKIELTYGSDFAGGRGHVLVAGQYSWQPDIVRAGSRDWLDFRAVVPNPAYVPGNGLPRQITVAGVGPAQLAQGGVITSTALRGIQFVGPNGTPAPYDFGHDAGVLQWGGDADHTISRARALADALDYGSLFAHVRYDVADNVTAYAEGSYGRSVMRAGYLYYNRVGNLPISVDNPWLDPGVRAQAQAQGITSFNIGKMVTDLDPPGSRNERVLWRGVAGLEGSFGGDWKWNAYYQYGQFRLHTQTFNNPLVPRFNEAVDAVRDPLSGDIVCRSTLSNPGNGCAPLNVLGVGVASPEAIDYVFGTVPYQILTLKQHVLSASLTGTLVNLPAGGLSVAVGGEYTSEDAVGTQDAESAARHYFTGNFQPFDGSRNVKEAFAEVVVPVLADLPLVRRLELNAAARLTDYSTSGSVATWKLGASWEVTPGLRLRVTRSRDIRAPSLSELFTKGATGTQYVQDPLTNAQVAILANTRGNPDLKPEVAATWTAGAVFSPDWLPGFGLSVDYYSIRLHDAIASVTAPQTLLLCYGPNPVLCDNIYRDSAGTITQIDLLPSNVAFLSTSGVDVEASYNRAVGPGTLSLRLLGSYLGKLDIINPDGSVNRQAGAIGDYSAGQPKLKAQLSATYGVGGFTGTAKVRYVGTAKLNNDWVEGVDVDNNSVPAAAYLDLVAAYRFDGLPGAPELSLLVANALNKTPPLVAAVPATVPYTLASPNTRMDLYDVIGRSFRVGARFKF